MLVLDGLRAIEHADLAGRHGEDSPASRSATLVGVFDGVHLGHQRLLHELLEMAARLDATPTVVTFGNHPDELLHGRRPDWITSLPHRLRLLRRSGARRVALLHFDDELRSMTAGEFTERILVRALRTRGLLLGHDGAIGKNREGTYERMRQLGDEHGFEVEQAEALLLDGRPVSSTAIRDAIRSGDLKAAQRLLGRWPAAFGEVVHGDRRGRTLGFPTANVVAQSLVLPPAGVYAVQVVRDSSEWSGVANLGARPTFDAPGSAPDDPPRLEVHLFDFHGDLYGTTLEVQFVARLRNERKFADLDELRTQITEDAARARALLGG
jgi:riboflavin kinase/FMN adenylyltransferase